jgi:hypothetical protein
VVRSLDSNWPETVGLTITLERLAGPHRLGPALAGAAANRSFARQSGSQQMGNRTRILSRESKRAMRFCTGWVNRDRVGLGQWFIHVRFALIATLNDPEAACRYGPGTDSCSAAN